MIDGGLTGVVGPNGCGKSNVVEALRWVMGENSAKRLRGDDMDDVIFSGTSTRPARNFAEAQLTLKTAGSELASRFPDADELVISRRIDRGSGSTFRINGKESRASDVRLLFADIASGAQSASIVAQGKVAALIDAKPTDRRALLEEAAGTTGLAGRRKEAETRLKASESNLTRVGDLTQALGEQLKTLEAQCVDAEKYSKLSDDIRVLEAMTSLVSYAQQTRAVERGREQKAKLTNKLADVQSEVTAMAASATNAAAALPALRTQDAEAGAKLQRLIVEREGVDREAARVGEATLENERATKQLMQDVERENTLAHDAIKALEKLATEEEALNAQKQGSEDAITADQEAAAQARTVLTNTEEHLTSVNAQLAKLDAEAASQRRILGEANARVQRLQNRVEQVGRELENARAKIAQGPDLDALAATHADAITAVESARTRQNQESQALDAALAVEREARNNQRDAQDAYNAVKNEQSALAKITQRGSGAAAQNNLLSAGDVSAAPGFEKALAAFMGPTATAALNKSLGSEAPAVWTSIGQDKPHADLTWPETVVPLAEQVEGPAALTRAFYSCGVADSIDAANRLQPQLSFGQILTSRDGGIWRWDGYAALPGAEERAAAERMAQVKRLEALDTQVAAANDALKTAQAAFEEARRAKQSQEQASNRAAQDLAMAQRQEREAETAVLKAEKDSSGVRVLLETLTEREAEAAAELTQAQDELASLPTSDQSETERPALVESIDQAKASVSAARQTLDAATGSLEQKRRDAATRDARLGQIFSERHDWEGRQQNAQHFQRSLVERQQALKEAAERLAAMPAQFAAQKSALNDAIVEAEAAKKIAADSLASAEAQDRNRQVELRALENEANGFSQELAGITASLEADETRLREIIDEVRETFGCGPQGLYERAHHDRETPLPNKGDVERKLKNRLRDRDALGAVNLRAAIERDALTDRLDTLANDTVELEAAIAKLRASIAEINKEGRQRLSEAFDTVNEAFKECFTKLFGGGKAELKLLEDKDDPLNSGLEIYAQPPGKKISNLSLMSGGERSLAAIALIFGLFRSNPAPICVLDEVDAPLDDHNVGRFVDLVGEMADELGTRFLVITHHAVTMAKMDRLYGVTMGEPGVSNAYSVDLRRAELALAS